MPVQKLFMIEGDKELELDVFFFLSFQGFVGVSVGENS